MQTVGVEMKLTVFFPVELQGYVGNFFQLLRNNLLRRTQLLLLVRETVRN